MGVCSLIRTQDGADAPCAQATGPSVTARSLRPPMEREDYKLLLSGAPSSSSPSLIQSKAKRTEHILIVGTRSSCVGLAALKQADICSVGD